MRISLNAERRDSFWTITKFPGFSGDPGSLKEISGRLSFLWDPIPNLEIRFKTDVNYIDQGGYPADPTVMGSARNIFHVSNDTHNMGFDKNFRTALDVKYTFEGGIALRSLTGYQYGRAAEQIDLDGGGPPDVFFRDKGIVRIFSQELNLISPDEGPLRWVLGGFFEHEDDDLPANDGFTIHFPPPPFPVDVFLTYHTPKQHEAVFGQITYEISDEFELQAGARFNHSSFDLTDHQVLAFGGVPVAVSNVPCTGGNPDCGPVTRTGHEEDSKFTGKVALNFKPDDRNYLYAFFATGHKDGGQNTTSNEPANIRPEEVRNAEIGWKSSFADDHIRTQLDGFWNDYKDFQVSLFDPNTNTTPIVNAPSAKIWGFEAQMQGGWDRLSFDLNGSYLHSRFGSFFAEPSMTVGTCDPHSGGTASSCENLTGEPNVYAPTWTVNGGAQYAFPLANGDTLTPRVDLAYLSSQWPSVFHTGPGAVPRLASRTITNAQVSYTMDQTWEFAVFATNLFDVHYVASENVSLRYAGPPQQIGFRVIKSF
jgi:iron complex outermembrane receptor protein